MKSLEQVRDAVIDLQCMLDLYFYDKVRGLGYYFHKSIQGYVTEYYICDSSHRIKIRWARKGDARSKDRAPSIEIDKKEIRLEELTDVDRANLEAIVLDAFAPLIELQDECEKEERKKEDAELQRTAAKTKEYVEGVRQLIKTFESVPSLGSAQAPVDKSQQKDVGVEKPAKSPKRKEWKL